MTETSMKEKLEEIFERHKQVIYWAIEEAGHPYPPIEVLEDLTSLIQQEREEAVEGFCDWIQGNTDMLELLYNGDIEGDSTYYEEPQKYVIEKYLQTSGTLGMGDSSTDTLKKVSAIKLPEEYLSHQKNGGGEGEK